MTALAERLKSRYFKQDHPYRTFELEVQRLLRPEHTLLDAGCGRTAPALSRYKGKCKRLIGVDVVDFVADSFGLELLKHDIADLPLESESVDIVMARSVMEHVDNPQKVYREIHRILKPGGSFVFLTANYWDYASLIAKLVPNRLHPWIVSRTEGRAEEDVFPVAYRTNTRYAVRKWAAASGFEVASFRYLGQYPAYFMFNGILFLLATAYEKLISSVSALNFLQGWILVRLVKPEVGASGY
ncbi:MAG TPA: class I SAM-dependent methyltransferase [Terriglobia bacterium]|nr:class I SAM-dependent methyltransferase [Terriglobia bacterium]